MSYYKVLGLQKEPFSTSPDPALFYLSKEHRSALYRLRISVKLKRGLSLILGDVGAGKTTLSRRFLQMTREDAGVRVHLILNPNFQHETEFLREVCIRFGIEPPASGKTNDLLNEIEGFLFKKSVQEGQTIVLLIDEAQKLNDDCLEALRGLLNYETNEYKILQLILVAQLEIVPRLKRTRNFWDRISLKHRLDPLAYDEMKRMITHRLRCVGYESPVQLFSEEAFETIYRATQGHPRQVTMLCHDCLEHLVMDNLGYVDRKLVERLVARESDLLARATPEDRPIHGIQTEPRRSYSGRASV